MIVPRRFIPVAVTALLSIWAAGSVVRALQTVAPSTGAPAEMALEVLPKNWTREQVDLVMETFNTSLGVDCDYCHAEDPDAPAPGPGEKPRLDYASNEKQEKAVSRMMVSLVMAINDDLEDEIVSCYTCHNGKATPAFTPSQGWGRGRFTFSRGGPTAPPADSAPSSR
jgi:hypothetical protein